MRPRARRVLAIGAVLIAGVTAAALLVRRSAVAREVDRLIDVLQIRSGSRVADVGAGKGGFAFAVARRVGSEGHVFATEIDTERLRQLREGLEPAGLHHLTVVEAGESDTGLAPGCCDAIYLRDVYHHLSDSRAVGDDLHRALVPGGRLLVIDFEPGWFLSRFFPVEGVPADRGGHGVPLEIVIAELAEAGFAVESRIDDWGLGTYALVFRKPDHETAL